MRRIVSLVILSALGLWAQGSGADDLYKEGSAALAKGDFAAAENVFRQLRANFPQDLRWGPGLIAAVSSDARLQGALEKGQETNPENRRVSTLYFVVGELLERAGRETDALKEFQAAARSAETPATRNVIYVRIGDTYQRLNQTDEAIAAYRQVNEGSWQAALQLGILLGAKGKASEAMAEYRRVLKQNPTQTTALNNLAYYMAERGENLDQALGYAQSAAKAKPEDASILDTLGWVYFKKGKLEDAESAMMRGLTQGITYSSRLHLAMVMDARAEWTGDRRELRKFLEGELSGEQTARMKELLRMQPK